MILTYRFIVLTLKKKYLNAILSVFFPFLVLFCFSVCSAWKPLQQTYKQKPLILPHPLNTTPPNHYMEYLYIAMNNKLLKEIYV